MNTAEFVTPMHPDKMCDRISDGVLDFLLSRDENARGAIETVGSHGLVLVTGEYRCKDLLSIELESNVRAIVAQVTGKTNLDVQIHLAEQSGEIAQGVDTGGAGDQGIMRGYATRETETYMPLEHELARSLCQCLYEKFPYDGKTQITLDDYGAIKAVVASFQNTPNGILKEKVLEWMMGKATHHDAVIHTNPAGDWNQGGFDADAGLTGRKLAVDNYGPRFPLGGGAFSGKDATKVDRSGAYMARKIAVDMLKARPELKQVDVELAYAIGVAQPVSAITTVHYTQGDPMQIPIEGYDLTPAGIINALDLRKPQFAETAKWGHFGNDNVWDR